MPKMKKLEIHLHLDFDKRIGSLLLRSKTRFRHSEEKKIVTAAGVRILGFTTWGVMISSL